MEILSSNSGLDPDEQQNLHWLPGDPARNGSLPIKKTNDLFFIPNF